MMQAMNLAPEALLILAVGAVGVLHTIVPDHWVPITLIARQRGWTRAQTARAALQAGTGHVVSTLAIGLIVWIAGVAFATRFGQVVSTLSSLALIAFGLWIAISSWLELRAHDAHSAEHEHAHPHGHSDSHNQTHSHDDAHSQKRDASSRTALLLILGSSPMIEGIPAFFAAVKYGPALIAIMSVVFAISTIATYVVLTVTSTAGLQKLRFGEIERYGEVLSGAFIAIVGIVFLIFPVL
jgi:ABC-type nickel/cobalt efflux system permease component RcnA